MDRAAVVRTNNPFVVVEFICDSFDFPEFSQKNLELTHGGLQQMGQVCG